MLFEKTVNERKLLKECLISLIEVRKEPVVPPFIPHSGNSCAVLGCVKIQRILEVVLKSFGGRSSSNGAFSTTPIPQILKNQYRSLHLMKGFPSILQARQLPGPLRPGAASAKQHLSSSAAFDR